MTHQSSMNNTISPSTKPTGPASGRIFIHHNQAAFSHNMHVLPKRSQNRKWIEVLVAELAVKAVEL